MKQITKEQIDETVSKVTTKVTENVSDLLIENIEMYEKNMNETGNKEMKKYSLYIATMTTALQMSVEIMKESLYDLFCETEKD